MVQLFLLLLETENEMNSAKASQALSNSRQVLKMLCASGVVRETNSWANHSADVDSNMMLLSV